MNYKKILDKTPNTYFLIKDKNNKVVYPKDKQKLDYIKKIYINYSKENKYSTYNDRNYKISKKIIRQLGKEYIILYFSDITELIKMKSYYEIDLLTTVLNRNAVLKKIDDFIIKNQSQFSIVMGDIDDFKKVNDNYGHMVGDIVLTEIGKLLKNELPDCLVGRYGGEEFIILVPNSENSFERIENIRKKIANTTIQYNDFLINNISMSFGINNVSEKQINQNVKCLRKKYIDNADKALYTSKENNKNKTTVY